MKKNIFRLLLFGLIFAVFAGCSGTITFESLLEEMTDREILTYFPDIEYSHMHFSSYDRASVSPNEKGWFANIDRSNFLRVEDNNGRREFVMVDAEGPGAIVRWWMTFYRAWDGVIRIYIDNDPEPVIEGSPADVLIGSLLAGYPFTASVQEGAQRRQEGWGYDHNFYLPLPFSRHIKITYECDLLEVLREGDDHIYYFPDVFYNIGYRAYQDNTRVESFSLASLEKAGPAIEKAGRALLTNNVHSRLEEDFEKQIMPGDSLVVEFNKNRHALNFLMLELEASNMNQALRSTVLQASFDGHQTVWIPVGEFFGSGYMTNAHKTWMNQRDENGRMESFYVMPFREECVLTILNYGNETIGINGLAGFTDYRWKPKSMYFGASWHEYHQVPTRDEEGSPYDLNFIELKGKGVYAGDQVTLFNNTHHWWGEGDEKIYVDGEAFPSVLGTGTEDYYGYSFGRPEVFSHPFVAQPAGYGNFSRGVTVNSRHRSLDAIPFNASIKADVELWHWDKETCTNYALASFYYIMPGFTRNIEPSVVSVRRPVALNSDDIDCD
ncbi:MAG: glycoside hydrolase family 172 protein [Bacteroidales bacterium]